MADDTEQNALTARQYNAIAALLSEPSVRKACEVANIPERTVYKWLKTPLFVAEYRAARREALQQAVAQLQQFSGAMARELLRLGLNARSEAVRLGAVSKGLELAFKVVELEDLEARLRALEERYAQVIRG